MSQVRTIEDYKPSKIEKKDFCLSQKTHLLKNQKKVKNKGKKTSWVWKWYQELYNDSFMGDENHISKNKRNDLAICLVCRDVIIRYPKDKKSPKKLISHLKIHGISFIEETLVDSDIRLGSTKSRSKSTSLDLPKEQQKKLHQDNVLLSNWYTDQPFGDSGNGKYKNDDLDLDEKKYTFYQLILDFLLENNLSIACIESSSFQDLLKFLNPDYLDHLKTLETLFSSFLEITGTNSEE